MADTISLDELDTINGKPARGRGGFRRVGDGETGAALIPSATRLTKKGTPYTERYRSPSGIGKIIENTYNLQKWAERRIVYGIASALATGDVDIEDLLTQLAVVADLESDDYRTATDAIAARAKTLAKAKLAADRGTHVHALTEDSDEGRSIIDRISTGEALDIDEATQRAVVEAWTELLSTNDLEVLTVEQAIVNDALRCAGTLDRTMRLGRDLGFINPATGELVTIPAGTVVVGDIKTSKLRYDEDENGIKGAPKFWQSFPIQIYVYASGVPYNTESEQRGSWGDNAPSTEHALVCHISLAKAGSVEAQLLYVDLALGKWAAQLATDAYAWGNNTEAFGWSTTAPVAVTVAAPAVDPDFDPFAGIDGRGPLQHPKTQPAETTPEEPAMNDDSMQPVTVILDAEVDRLARRAKLQARIDRLREATPEALGQLATMLSAADLPSLKRSDDHTPTQLDRIGEMIATLERNHPVPFDPELDGTPSPAPEPRPVRDMVEVAPRRAPIVDVADGTIGAEDVAAINTARHHLNDEGRAWFKERVNESIRSGQPPQMGGNDGVMCARRFEVACALVAGARYVTAAGSVAAVSECNELIRSACILAGEPLAAQPAFDLGNVIGHMDAATARRLTELIDGLTASDPKICGMVLAAVA